MSVILFCRKFFEVNVVNRLKVHTLSRSQVLLKRKNLVPPIRRHIFQWFRRPKASKLKIQDNIPDQYELIYRSTVERYIFYTQLGTTISTVVIVLTLLIMHGAPKQELTFYGNTEDKPTSNSQDVDLYIGFFFTIVVLLQVLISKMPLRIYYLSQQKNYIFIFPSSLPLQIKKLSCKVGDVVKLPEGGMLPWKDSRFLVNNERNAILLEDNFKKPADLYIMLGIQKDPDDEDTK